MNKYLKWATKGWKPNIISNLVVEIISFSTNISSNIQYISLPLITFLLITEYPWCSTSCCDCSNGRWQTSYFFRTKLTRMTRTNLLHLTICKFSMECYPLIRSVINEICFYLYTCLKHGLLRYWLRFIIFILHPNVLLVSMPYLMHDFLLSVFFQPFFSCHELLLLPR